MIPDVIDGASESEYLSLDNSAQIKYEYINGQIIAMAGASPEHNQIQGNIIGSLWNQIRSGNKNCDALGSDQRLRATLDKDNSYTYPDVAMFCDEFTERDGATLTNPVLIVEILSDETEKIDRGKKWDKYRRIQTLKNYILVSQNEKKVEVYSRMNSKWQYECETEGSISLNGLNMSLDLDELYYRVKVV